ncbi:NADH-quinone oxidoreductase subunit NuoH [soil metagenome]
MPDNVLYALITVVVVMGALQGTCAYLIMVERKVCAWMQDRIGPNRVGPFGLLQPIADGLKFLLKEDIIPDHVDKFLFLMAPSVSVSTALLAFVVVPFGATNVAGMPNPASYQFVIAPGLDIGIVFIFAISSLNVYGIVLGGWASNNKYSFLGAVRSSAQLISYEIPMGMSILGIVLVTGSLNLEQIIGRQAVNGFFGWNIWYQPLAFLLFLTSVLAECNRVPFDLAEAEQELVGGYHTEYSALKFGLFFLGEYTHVITTSFLLTILFLGGWQFPWIAEADSTGILAMVLKLVVFAAKMFGFIILYMLIRWTIPRFRFDQLMSLAWQVMMPLCLLNLVGVAFVKQFGWSEWLLLPYSLILLFGFTFLAGFWPEQNKRALVTNAGR